MNKQSMLDAAYEFLKTKNGETVSFDDLFNHVSEVLEIPQDDTDDKKSTFYTNLVLDGRFILLSDNTWDLRSLHPSDEYEIDMKNAYNDTDDSDESTSDADDEDDEDEEIEEKEDLDVDDSDNSDYESSDSNENNMY